MKLLYHWFISALAVMGAAYLIPGVEVSSLKIGFVTALVLGVINVTIKPVLKLLTLPLNVLSLGLFGLAINTFLIMFADQLIDGFAVEGLITALIFSFVLGVINSILSIFK